MHEQGARGRGGEGGATGAAQTEDDTHQEVCHCSQVCWLCVVVVVVDCFYV